jgi:hypothetical protein
MSESGLRMHKTTGTGTGGVPICIGESGTKLYMAYTILYYAYAYAYGDSLYA